MMSSHLKSHGIENRLIDRIPASPRTVEEYQHVLMPSTGKNKLECDECKESFTRLCATMWQRGGGDGDGDGDGHAKFLLHKNPPDAGMQCAIAGMFPDAKWVHITRGKMPSFNSFVKLVLHFSEAVNPYYSMFSTGCRSWWARGGNIRLLAPCMETGSFILGIMRLLRLVLGRALFT